MTIQLEPNIIKAINLEKIEKDISDIKKERTVFIRMSDKKRILLTGWFSLRGTKTNTWGDIQAMQVVTDWLTKAGYTYDILSYIRSYEIASGSFGAVRGISTVEDVNPADYNTLIFICGPWMLSLIHISEPTRPY